MSANDIATRNPSALPRGRLATVALWIMQVALAAMFLLAGGSKLAGAPAMVTLFGSIGVGQWFRYVTGAIEVSAAVALLIPSGALFGAMLLIPTMVGAAAAQLYLGQSPTPPLVLMFVALAIAWGRRGQFRTAFSR